MIHKTPPTRPMPVVVIHCAGNVTVHVDDKFVPGKDLSHSGATILEVGGVHGIVVTRVKG